MSYTNIDLIRNHIEYIQPVSNSISDQRLVCDSDASLKFFSGSIKENSVVVKTITDYVPSSFNVLLTVNSFSIYSSPLVRGSVICASDSSLGTIYKENIDYLIDYDKGNCILKSSGQINIGMSLTFFFIPYSLYNENSDYKIDYSNGFFQRTVSGNIQLGETLYINYAPIYNNYTDEILQNAVTEANAIIENQVDPDKQFGADLVLQTAATYRALEILCRSSAMRELISPVKKDTSAASWIKLAELYTSRSEKLVLTFKAPKNKPHKPTHS